MGKFNYDRAAMVLVDALYSDDQQAAERHGLTDRTVKNYRKRLETDRELSLLFDEKKQKRETVWADELPAAISAGVDYLRRVAKSMNPSEATPEMIHAITGSVKILSEIRLTKDVLDVRLADENRSTDRED